MNETDNTKNDLRDRLGRNLNEHGYSFHQSLLKAIKNLDPKILGWKFEVSEFPVEVRGKGTRIDFILKRFQTERSGNWLNDNQTTLLVAECKRANPAFSNWCFVKIPFLFNRSDDAMIFEEVHPVSRSTRESGGYHVPNLGMSKAQSKHRKLYLSLSKYHIGIEVKKISEKGNSATSDPGKGAIEQAATQICLGLNGLVNHLAIHDDIWNKNPPVSIIPAIFTTANLWVSDADLSEADINTGNIDISNYAFKEVPWLFYQYILSPGIRHNLRSLRAKNTFSDFLEADYVRTVLIVNSAGLAKSIQLLSSLDFEP